ncbi:hypothetical protein CRUP_018127 [Coryphaenoides rupestris]|nr:hypothetical protein CRUP_018127 [Coryphaenoides rupestris]
MKHRQIQDGGCGAADGGFFITTFTFFTITSIFFIFIFIIFFFFASSCGSEGRRHDTRALDSIMAITQFRLFKICTCIASLLAFFKRLICRTGRGRKLSGDQVTLPTTVDFQTSGAKQIEVWSSWDEDAPTSIKIEGGNGNVSPSAEDADDEPDYFKDMAPTIRKTQKAELGEMDTWQGDANAWEDESEAAWEAEEVLRQQKMAEREKRTMEQQRKKIEKDVQRMMKKDQKIAVKLS